MEERCATEFVRRGVLGIFVFLLSSTVVFGSTYYVRSDGSNSNTGLTNSPAGAWLTVSYAAAHVAAGDTVRVQAGRYAETVTPTVNGTSVTSTVTFVADGAVTMGTWSFNGNSYIRVVGFTIDPSILVTNTYNVSLNGTNSYLEFWHNALVNGRRDGFRANGTINNSLIIGNTIGPQLTGRSATTDYGNAITVAGSNNLVAYNTIVNWDYIAINVAGNHNRILNNYAYGLQEINGRHPDFIYMGGNTSSYNLFDAYYALGTPAAYDNKLSWMEPYTAGSMTGNVFRRFVAHNLGSAGFGQDHNDASNRVDYSRIYQNTLVDLDRGGQTGVGYGFAYLYGAGSLDCYVYNNIAYETWTPDVTTGIGVFWFSNAVTHDYNLAYDTVVGATYMNPFTSETHRWTTNPSFTNYAGDDFSIGSVSSPAVGHAGPLTVVASTSGTGATFSVATNGGGFFFGSNATNLAQYGGALVPGDMITVGTTTRQIASISGDTVTVTQPLTWTTGQPVYFGSSATPDLGAYPYKPSGYTLTAGYLRSSSNVTIIPNDASLVRFVVCYEDGIPTTVVNAAPYVCSMGDGNFSARVYPLYASATLSVEAGPMPAAPTDVVIRN